MSSWHVTGGRDRNKQWYAPSRAAQSSGGTDLQYRRRVRDTACLSGENVKKVSSTPRNRCNQQSAFLTLSRVRPVADAHTTGDRRLTGNADGEQRRVRLRRCRLPPARRQWEPSRRRGRAAERRAAASTSVVITDPVPPSRTDATAQPRRAPHRLPQQPARRREAAQVEPRECAAVRARCAQDFFVGQERHSRASTHFSGRLGGSTSAGGKVAVSSGE